MECLMWRDSAHSAVWNMAADKLLLDWFGSGSTPVIRFYYWIKPAITCGRSQPLPTHDTIRRPTGGGIVHHGNDTAYTVILPAGHIWNKLRRDECYLKIHSIVAEALTNTGIPNVFLQPAQTQVDDRTSMQCFIQPSKYDVMGENGKLAGAAQWKSRTGTLHQGSIASGNPLIAEAFAQAWRRATGDEFTAFRPDIKFYEAVAEKLE